MSGAPARIFLGETPMLPTVTVVLDPYEDYERPYKAQFLFNRALETLLTQAYPSDRLDIVMPCTEAEVAVIAPHLSGQSRVHVLPVPVATGYYQKKNLGILHATSELVLLADGDCLYPPDWIPEMVAAFDRGGSRVAAVQGVSRFAHTGPYARALDPVYWRAYEPEGPIRRVYSAHNLGLRRADAPHFLFEDTPLRAGLERAFSERILRAERVIWHNRRVTVQHEGSQSLPELWTQALGRGRCRALLWEEHPSPLERRWGTPGWFGTLLYVAAVALRDSGKQFRDLSGRGLRGAGLLKLPGYVLLTVAFHIASGVGMFSTLAENRRHAANLSSPSAAPEVTGHRDATAPAALAEKGASRD